MNHKITNNIVIIGYGSIGQAILPILIKEFTLSANQIHIINAESINCDIVHSNNIATTITPLQQNNYYQILQALLKSNDILLNLSVNVSSVDLIKLCQEIGALYLDTCIEPWKGHYTDSHLNIAERSNYALRENALKLKAQFPKGSTAILAHGANPGLVSHFVKQGLINLASDQGISFSAPKTQQEWAELAYQLQIKVIHVAEFDWQKMHVKRNFGDFFCTWSVDGLISEGLQPSELGWGAHEQDLPRDAGVHEEGCKSSIYLKRPGFSTRVRSWTPRAGEYQGYLITHNEAISIADYFSLKANDQIIYRPTVMYAYRPSNETILSIHEMEGKNFKDPLLKKVIVNEAEGVDELGVFLMGGKKGSYWYGSHLEACDAKAIAPNNNATTMQVVGGIMGALYWAIANPKAGILEAEDLDFTFILEKAKPYLGTVGGVYTNWQPLDDQLSLFGQKPNSSCVWQFENFRVT